MKAVVKQKRGDGFVELVEKNEPIATDGSVILRVGSAGICGSDLMILHDRFPNYNVPVTLGHEFAGTVEKVASDSSFSRGERVVCETHAYVCNVCNFCKSGKYNLCMERKGFGYGVDGAFANFVKVRVPIIHRLPEKITIEEAAVLEPTSVVVNALNVNSRINPNDSVIVFGPGPIGLLALQLARLSGANVTLVGTDKSRQRLEFGSRTFNADKTMIDSEMRDEDYSNKYDVSIIATGSPDSFELALRAVRKLGRVIHIGESTAQANFQFSLIERKNLTVQGSFSHNWPVWEKAISLVNDGKIKVKPLITHKFNLEDWKMGFDAAESRVGVKVLINP